MYVVKVGAEDRHTQSKANAKRKEQGGNGTDESEPRNSRTSSALHRCRGTMSSGKKRKTRPIADGFGESGSSTLAAQELSIYDCAICMIRGPDAEHTVLRKYPTRHVLQCGNGVFAIPPSQISEDWFSASFRSFL